MEQEEITSLAKNVYEFKEALKRLTNVFLVIQASEEVSGTVHESLNDVLRILKHLLENYPGLQSTDVLIKTKKLIKCVQSNDDPKNVYEFINQVAVAFCIRVSEYIIGGENEHNILHISSTDQVPRNSIEDCLHHREKNSILKRTTFGVDLTQQLNASGTTVPHIVSKCIHEIDERGIFVKGIYRVSGVKSKVEKLCQEFEADGQQVDLSGIHPNIIANVLKLYLRQLPQPLFTYELYTDFVRFAKNWPCGSNSECIEVIEELKAIITKLPTNCYNTVKVLMQHLKRVSKNDEVNNMSPGNLGIVFGPTLLRTLEGHSSINSLLDTVHQSRAIELIITSADKLFPP